MGAIERFGLARWRGVKCAMVSKELDKVGRFVAMSLRTAFGTALNYAIFHTGRQARVECRFGKLVATRSVHAALRIGTL